MKTIYQYDVLVGDSCGERFFRRSDARKAKAEYKASGFDQVKIVQRKWEMTTEREVR